MRIRNVNARFRCRRVPRRFEQLDGLHVPALLSIQQCQIVQRRGDLRMRRAELAFPVLERALQTRLGLFVLPPVPIHLAELAQRCAEVGMVGIEQLLLDRQRTLEIVLCVFETPEPCGHPTGSGQDARILRIELQRGEVALQCNLVLPARLGADSSLERTDRLRVHILCPRIAR